MSAGRRLPAGARFVLSRFLPEERAHDVAGDLEELVRRIPPSGAQRRRQPSGGLARWWWVWKQVLSICASYLKDRVDRRRRKGSEGKSSIAFTSSSTPGSPRGQRPAGAGPGRPPGRWLEAVARDLRGAFRAAGSDPATTAIAVVTLALAIGSATAVVSLADAVLFEPLPFAEPERLYSIRATNPQVADLQGGVSHPDLLDLEEAGQGFEVFAGHYPYSAVMTAEDVPLQLTVGYTSLNFFSVLRVPPLAGRPYTAQPERGLEPANPVLNPRAVAVISDAFWHRAFGADPGAIGRRVMIDGRPRRILGVMPAELGLPAGDIDVWLPWDLNRQRRNDRFLGVVGRLRPGYEAAEAQAELQAAARGLADRFPDTNAGWSVAIEPLQDVLLADLERPMWILSAAVFLVLAIAAANVAGVLLARNWRRSREIAVRRALGGSSWTIARGLLAESAVPALLATILGVGLGRLALGVLPLMRADLPVRGELAADGGTRAASFGLAMLAGLLAGLTPALHATRQDPLAGLKEGGRASASRGQLRLRAALVAAEAALVMVLLVAAGLLLESFVRLTSVSSGFEPANVVVGRVELEPGSAAARTSRVEFFDNLLADLRSRPEVSAAGATTVLPMDTSGTDFNRPYWRYGEPNPGGTAPEADIRMVSPGYFRALGIPLLSGRDFGAEDRFDSPEFNAGQRVAVANRSLAERTWPGSDGVGQLLVMDYPRQVYVYEIVGVVDDVRYYGPRNEPRPEVYIPYAQNPYPGMSIVVRVRDDPQRLIDTLPRIVADLNPAQPVHDVVAMEQLVADIVARDRLLTMLLMSFGLLALVVAAVGVYGLVGASVASRTRELDIRRAVGARGIDLVGQVLFEALRLGGAGIAVGTLLALSLVGFLDDLLYQTDAADPVTVVGVALFLWAVVGLAAIVPARQALRVDPATSLGSP